MDNSAVGRFTEAQMAKNATRSKFKLSLSDLTQRRGIMGIISGIIIGIITGILGVFCKPPAKALRALHEAPQGLGLLLWQIVWQGG